ncbi:MAG: pseudouridine synthase [Acidobacteriota bacterium]
MSDADGGKGPRASKPAAPNTGADSGSGPSSRPSAGSDRVQKLLARAGLASRRAVEEWIRQKRVTINGRVAGLGDKADPSRDAVKVDGKRVNFGQLETLYLLLHKPANVVSTTSDPEGRRTVLDLVPKALQKGLVTVGRLDFQTTGLLLLTNDGDFAQRVAHPRYGCTKTYEVKVAGDPSEKALDRLRRGIVLDGKRTAPAEIERRTLPRGQGSDGTEWFTVELTEGRTRQIREMFLRIGHAVRKLRRVAIGGLRDSRLPPGHWRELSPEEVRRLLIPRRIKAPPKRPRRPRPEEGQAEARKTAAGKPGARKPSTGPGRRSAGGPGRAGSKAGKSPRGRGAGAPGRGGSGGRRGPSSAGGGRSGGSRPGGGSRSRPGGRGGGPKGRPSGGGKRRS